MNNEQFDRLLQEKMAHHQIPPPPHVWYHIEKQTGTALKKSRRLWFPILLIALLPATVLYHFLNNPASLQQAPPSVSDSADPVTRPYHVFSNVPPSSSVFTDKPLTHRHHPEQAKNLAVTPSDAQSTVQTDEPVQSLSSTESSVEPIPHLWMSHLDYDIDPSPVSLFLPALPVNPPVQNLSFVLTAGPMLASKLLASKYHLADDKRYIAFRQQTERFASAWSSSLLLQADLTSNFFIRTGILYQTINDNIWLRYIRVRIDGVVSDTIVGSRNQTTPPAQLLSISEDEDYTLLSDYVLTGSTRYRFISILVLAGGQLKFSGFALYATAGLSLHFNTIYHGQILAPDSAFLLNIGNPATSPFDKIVGFSLIGAAGIEYFITPKFSLLLEPAFYYQMPDMTRINYRLSQRFRSWSFQSGLRYRLQ
jgi:hypothetical protein